MAKLFIAGNWKMYGSNALLERFASFFASKDTEGLGLSIPYIYLNKAKQLFHDSAMCIGAQDVSEHEYGAYTGCVSAAMLAEAGCDFCLVGHSERRQYQQETSHQVAAKIQQLNTFHITPVLCVGENLKQRQNNQTVETVISQLTPCVEMLQQAQDPIIAYEPIWAIGTGKTATDEQAQQVHQAIRKYLGTCNLGALSVIYGGSVKPDNAAVLLKQQDINGALVGGASLEPESFYAITGR